MPKMQDRFVKEIIGNVRETGTALGHVGRVLAAARSGKDVGAKLAEAERDLARLPVAESAEPPWRQATGKLDPKRVTRVETIRSEKAVPPGTGHSRG